MTQQIVNRSYPETENVCTKCKHFVEFDESFFCRYFDAFLSAESLTIPCDFQEEHEIPDFTYYKERTCVRKLGKDCII